MMRYSKAPLTEGPISLALVRLSVPIILANILQTAYQLTDTFWVGRLERPSRGRGFAFLSHRVSLHFARRRIADGRHGADRSISRQRG